MADAGKWASVMEALSFIRDALGDIYEIARKNDGDDWETVYKRSEEALEQFDNMGGDE